MLLCVLIDAMLKAGANQNVFKECCKINHRSVDTKKAKYYGEGKKYCRIRLKKPK